ncbi:hypothetical protein VNO77_27358 [Canavalia gladiata]|uniref:Vacuolar protein sorting-associated protein 62 n=1 Tax=Canavalia gladiata TaxID=3824 RepID=A0AAN9KVM6_CANGL
MDMNAGIICAVLLWTTLPIGIPAAAPMKQFSGNFPTKSEGLPIDTIFQLPSALPAWPSGSNFSRGIIDLGGLQVSQVSTFNKIWGTYDGGPDDQGFAIFEPSGIPEGFSTLGSYAQPNNKPFFGWVLVGKDVSTNSSNPSLKQPIDYTQVWNSTSDDGLVFFWLPTAPNGYQAVGHVVTTTPDKPSLDKIKCVRLDLTDQCETNSWIWGFNSFNVYDVRPSNRGIQAPGVPVGTFVAQNGENTGPLSIACLKNNNTLSTYMPNLQQIEEILKVYAPTMYLHPDEEYLPSSVNWFFSNGSLLYKKGEESNPVTIALNGTNLPQDANSDDAYWLDLPADDENKDRVKKGDLQSANTYAHVKPMLGGTFTDIALWVFYPFNGSGRLRVKFSFIKLNIKLGKIGEHVGDWEHVTLRVSNFNGQLLQVYFSQHNKGVWVDSSQLEFQSGNKPVVYSSLHGHASYPHVGMNLRESSKIDGIGEYKIDGIGVRNDTDKSDLVMDMGAYELVSAEYLGSAVVEPPWLNYFREWGPKISYKLDDELDKIRRALPGKLKSLVEKIIKSLPNEILGQEGPTGPKVKDNWSGDEV